MPVPPLHAPGQFPGFKTLGIVGKGSYGKVYKVQRESDGEVYALKEAELSSVPLAERQSAVNEVRLLVSMSNSMAGHVIRYHEAFLSGTKLCVVQELASHGDLASLIKRQAASRRPFEEAEVWCIFLQLCRGLSALHGARVVHRDMKPANIFICSKELVKIGDLGIAKALKNGLATTVIGTPIYMAPEVWSGKPYDFSSDMWSLGCIVYEMMTFRTAFTGTSMQGLKTSICSGRYVPIPQGKYSKELVDMVQSMIVLDPKKRPTAVAVLASAAADKWIKLVPDENAVAHGPGLLSTIMVPSDLRKLQLPPPSYEDSRPPTGAEAPAAADPKAGSRAVGASKPESKPERVMEMKQAVPQRPSSARRSRPQAAAEAKPSPAAAPARPSSAGRPRSSSGAPPSAAGACGLLAARGVAAPGRPSSGAAAAVGLAGMGRPTPGVAVARPSHSGAGAGPSSGAAGGGPAVHASAAAAPGSRPVSGAGAAPAAAGAAAAAAKAPPGLSQRHGYQGGKHGTPAAAAAPLSSAGGGFAPVPALGGPASSAQQQRAGGRKHVQPPSRGPGLNLFG